MGQGWLVDIREFWVGSSCLKSRLYPSWFCSFGLINLWVGLFVARYVYMVVILEMSGHYAMPGSMFGRSMEIVPGRTAPEIYTTFRIVCILDFKSSLCSIYLPSTPSLFAVRSFMYTRMYYGCARPSRSLGQSLGRRMISHWCVLNMPFYQRKAGQTQTRPPLFFRRLTSFENHFRALYT